MDGEDQSNRGSLWNSSEGKWLSHLPEHPGQQVRNAGAAGPRGASIKLSVVSGILMTRELFLSLWEVSLPRENLFIGVYSFPNPQTEPVATESPGRAAGFGQDLGVFRAGLFYCRIYFNVINELIQISEPASRQSVGKYQAELGAGFPDVEPNSWLDFRLVLVDKHRGRGTSPVWDFQA